MIQCIHSLVSCPFLRQASTCVQHPSINGLRLEIQLLGQGIIESDPNLGDSRYPTAFEPNWGAPRALLYQLISDITEDLRREHRQLFGQEVAFDMRRFFAHKDQRAAVMYILGMYLIDLYG